MDIRSLKQQSDHSFNLAVAKKNALERAKSRQLFAYKDHLFRADADTINLVYALKQNNKKFFVLDANDNPCEIENPEEFLQLLIERNQETLNQYHQLHEQLKSKE
jgi:thymidylate kinase